VKRDIPGIGWTLTPKTLGDANSALKLSLTALNAKMMVLVEPALLAISSHMIDMIVLRFMKTAL